MEAESGIFKTDAAVYIKRLFSRYLSDKWYVFVLTVLPFIILSFFNLNFIYVALMAVFIILPMLLGFVYVYYAFSEECVSSIRRSRIKFNDNSVEWEYVDEQNETINTRIYKWTDFCRYEITTSYVLLYPAGKGLRFLLLPLYAFSTEESILLLKILPIKINS